MNVYFRIRIFSLYFIQLFIHLALAFFRSSISLTSSGTTFMPNSQMEISLKTVTVSSILRCSKQCNDNDICRTFIYDSASWICQFYQSDLQTGNITVTNISTSRVGLIRYFPQFYTNYNRTCDQRRMSTIYST